MRTFVRFSILVSCLLLLSSCSLFSEQKKKPPEGRCFTNSDCDEGFRCSNTHCEDIYFPRKDMKPY